MKLSIHLALVTVITASSSLPAFAGEGRGARFDFAPNHWKVEESRLPVDNYVEPAHSVRQGSVPKNLLGLDPSMLVKPVQQMPMANPTVAARVVSPVATPQFLPKGRFNPAFGQPIGAQPLAQLPNEMPQQAAARPMASPSRPDAAPAHSAPRHAYTTAVAARLRPPHKVVPTMATPAVLSYGQNVGYAPGPYLTQGGSNSTTKVSGRILRSHK